MSKLLQFQKGRSALSRCCLAPFLSFTVMLFCCSGGYRFFPWRQEAVAETHAKASFLQFQNGRSALSRCCLAPVFLFTAMLFCCSGGYRFFPWRQELEAVAETHAKASFLQFQNGSSSALFRCCLAPVLSFTVMLFCCSGGYRFLPQRQKLEAKASFLQFQNGRSALSRCCLAPVLSFTVMLFCCSGGYRFLPQPKVRSKSFFSTVSEWTFGTFSVLFGTRFVLHCHAALLFGRV